MRKVITSVIILASIAVLFMESPIYAEEKHVGAGGNETATVNFSK